MRGAFSWGSDILRPARGFSAAQAAAPEHRGDEFFTSESLQEDEGLHLPSSRSTYLLDLLPPMQTCR
jgi:hypothetical protein